MKLAQRNVWLVTISMTLILVMVGVMTFISVHAK
jgi:hypothetical protein